MKFPSSLVQATCPTPLGPLLLAATPQGLAGVWFSDQQHHPAEQARAWRAAPEHPVLVQAAAQLQAYFAPLGQGLSAPLRSSLKAPLSPSAPPAFDLPLDLSAGTPFQQAVWQALLRIAPGTTTSYAELSAGIGRASAVRAVAGAIGRNPLSIVVPCHRVLGRGGSLTGYAGGLQRKAALLQLEGVW